MTASIDAVEVLFTKGFALEHGSDWVGFDDLGAGVQIVEIRGAAGIFRFGAAPLFDLSLFRLNQNLGFNYRSNPAALETEPAFVRRDTRSCQFRWLLRWRRPAGSSYRGRVLVIATFRLEDDGLECSLSIETNTNLVALEDVRFPILRILTSETHAEDDAFIWPWQGGGIIRDPAHRVVQSEQFIPLSAARHPSFQSAMQFWAYSTRRGAMLYLQTFDTNFIPKEFVPAGAGDSFVFAMKHFPADNFLPGNGNRRSPTWEMPYRFVISVMRGNWYDATFRYRQWALKQAWVPSETMRRSKSFSTALRNAVTGVVRGNPDNGGTNFNNFEIYATDLIRLSEYLGNRQIISFWFYWHTNRFDSGFPSTKWHTSVPLALKRTQDYGLKVAFYTLPEYWDISNPATMQRHMTEYMQKFPSGATLLIPSGTVQDSFRFRTGVVNPHFEEARTEIMEWARLPTRDLGVDGIYLDVWSGGSTPIDYNARLGVTGGTSLWTAGRQKFGRQIANFMKSWDGEVFRRPERWVMSEFSDESLIEYSESVTIPIAFQAESQRPFAGFVPVPLFGTVYHEYQLATDLISPLDTKEGFQEELVIVATTVAYHYGIMMGLFSSRDPETLIADPPAKTRPIRLWNFLRRQFASMTYAKPFQRWGERLRPIAGSPEDAIDKPDLLGAGDVWLSAWRHEGRIGVLLTNLGPEPQDVRVVLPRALYPLPELGLVIGGLKTSRSVLGKLSGDLDEIVRVEADDFELIEVIPVATEAEFERMKGVLEFPMLPDSIVVARNLVLAMPDDDLVTEIQSASQIFPSGGATMAVLQIAIINLEPLDGESRLTIEIEQSNDGENWFEISITNITDVGLFLVQSRMSAAFVRVRYHLRRIRAELPFAAFSIALLLT